MSELETERLILRRWKKSDREPFARMSTDPESMKYLGGTWDKTISDGFIDRMEKHFNEHGYGIYALEHKQSRELIGFTGLRNVPFETHFTPAVEIGWRLAPAFWRQGYAFEAATESLRHGFNDLGLKEIVSFTSPVNISSWSLMKKLGMQTDPKDNFRHPKVPAGDVLSEHVLYRLRKE